jgi:hypothetical protein
MSAESNHLEQLIIEMKESLEREMQAGFAAVTDRFDLQATRLDRQGALMQTGNRWISRINDWSDRIDAALEARDKQIAELRARVEKLEGGGNGR